MSLKASFVYKNVDSTRDLNARLRRIVGRGIVWGGTMVPGVGLTVQVAPLTAVGFDGMTVEEDASQILTVVGGGVKQYVVIHVRYNEGGVPATPTMRWRVLTQAAYAADPEKDYLIVVGTVTPVGVVVLLSEIDFTERDEITPLGRDQYRGAVANAAALPLPPPMMNRVGDFYFVNADHTFYFWTGLIWEPLNTGSYNSETTLMNEQVIRQQRDRAANGTGILAGIRQSSKDYGDEPDGLFSSSYHISLIDSPIATNLGIDTFSALVNGHYVEVHAQEVLMNAPPMVPGSRLDLIFLEVWREAVVVPETHTYEGNTTLAGPPPPSFTLDQVRQKFEQSTWSPSMAVAGSNVNLDEVNADNHDWSVVRHRIARVDNVPSTTLYDNTVGAPLSTNVDGNPFVGGASSTDLRVWSAAAPLSSADGVSWAIPLFVVRRDFGEPNIREFRSNVRKVMPVYPVCDRDNAARQLLDTVARKDETVLYPGETADASTGDPSGFITGLDLELKTKLPSVDSIYLYDLGCEFRIRGMRDWLVLPASGGGASVPIGTAPPANWYKILLYLKMNITLYADEFTKPQCCVSSRHRPLLPSALGTTLKGLGQRRGYVSYEVVARNLGAIDVSDERDSMVADGWSRGDGSFSNGVVDGGIWSRAISLTVDDRVHPLGMEWAIPICLIHRRNSALYNVNTNPNGSGVTRPDARTQADVISPDDLVDLRHQVDIGEAELDSLLEQNVDLLMKGQLRTKMANKIWGSGTGGAVAGSRILQADSIGVVPGAYSIGVADGMRRIWSDAREFHLVSTSFFITVDTHNDYIDYDYTAPDTGVLVIKAPPGAHIVRAALPLSYVVSDPTNLAYYMDFFGPPLFSTRFWPDVANNPAVGLNGQPFQSWAKFITATGQELPVVYHELVPLGSTVTVMGCPWAKGTGDNAGHATSMGTSLDVGSMIALGGVVISLSWWVHYDRSFVDSGRAYDQNRGLAEIPDVVHKVVKDPAGAADTVNVGAIYASARKLVFGALNCDFLDVDIATFADPALPGTIKLVGIDLDTLNFTPFPPSTAAPVIQQVTMNDAQTKISLVFAAAYTGAVEVVIAYYTDQVNDWIEVGRGGKSVQAMFKWMEVDQDLGAGPWPDNLAMQFGNTIWVVPQINGRHSSALSPLLWSRAAAGLDWELMPSLHLTTSGVGYPYSNVLSANPNSVTGLQRLVKFVLAFQYTLTNAPTDNLLIYYTYTPYQGMSNRGGETPVTTGVGSVVPLLKNMLHGKIESSTDFYVTQSGAASYFSGVLGMSGLSVNHSAPYTTSTFLTNASRFADYNMTYQVTDHTRFYTDGLNSNYNADHYTNDAAVLRLPYPQHTSMVNGTLYHLGTMDFDLDPARAGVNAGFLSYAPGYYAPPMVDMRQTQYSQFVNGLTPLNARGGAKREDLSFVVTPDQYYVYPGTGAGTLELRHDANGYGWYVAPAPANYIRLRHGIDTHGGALVCRTFTEITADKPPGVDGPAGTQHSGLHLYSPVFCNLWYNPASLPSAPVYPFNPATYLISDEDRVELAVFPCTVDWTYIPDFVDGVYNRYGMCACPGEVISWYSSGEKGVTPVIGLLIEPNDGHYARVFGTSVLMETCVEENFPKGGNPMFGNLDFAYKSSRVLDLVKVPLSSYSKQQEALDRNASQGTMTLKGKSVGYPGTWSGSSTMDDAVYAGPRDIRGAGRGIYFGDETNRFNMPVLCPGTGTPLNQAFKTWPLSPPVDGTWAPPESLPYMPGESFFHQTNQVSYPFDHGGPIAYVFMGSFVRPISKSYRNSLILQISGGPTGPDKMKDQPVALQPAYRVNTSEELDGTALDAFWPKNRPILRAK
jgi:hypothetical protein